MPIYCSLLFSQLCSLRYCRYSFLFRRRPLMQHILQLHDQVKFYAIIETNQKSVLIRQNVLLGLNVTEEKRLVDL